jgi:acylphosphatase
LDKVIRRFRVEGKVQGVFFRHSTRGQAQALAIAGFARNLPDGSVEVLAHGSNSAVEELQAWLWHGPATARVDNVQELELDLGLPLPESFEIR